MLKGISARELKLGQLIGDDEQIYVLPFEQSLLNTFFLSNGPLKILAFQTCQQDNLKSFFGRDLKLDPLI